MNPVLFIALVLGSVNITQQSIDNLNVMYQLTAQAPSGKAIVGEQLQCGDSGPFDWKNQTRIMKDPTGQLKAGLTGVLTSWACEYPAPGTYTATWSVQISDGTILSTTSTVTVTSP